NSIFQAFGFRPMLYRCFTEPLKVSLVKVRVFGKGVRTQLGEPSVGRRTEVRRRRNRIGEIR
uniref:hypothetical protein n=1 Tax=Okeania sp. SIO2F4 TaxID=2607790 RepID=UPI0025E18B6C